MSKQGTVKVATFNANSIRARLPIVLDWLKTENPDLLAIQETKAMDKDFPKEAFESAGWHVVFRGQKSYNGTAFVSKKPLDGLACYMDPRNPEEDCRFMSAWLDDVLIFNTYVPQGYLPDSPKFAKKLAFLKELRGLFQKQIKAGQPALWMGDLNVAPTEIDLWDPKRNALHVCFHPLARQAFHEVCRHQWIDLFRTQEPGPGHYTFWDYLWPSSFEKNKGWRIDHIMGTEPMKGRLKRIWIDKEPRKRERPSDHTFLAAEFETKD